MWDLKINDTNELIYKAETDPEMFFKIILCAKESVRGFRLDTLGSVT